MISLSGEESTMSEGSTFRNNDYLSAFREDLGFFNFNIAIWEMYIQLLISFSGQERISSV